MKRIVVFLFLTISVLFSSRQVLAAESFNAEYYNNTSFSGTPVFIQTDSQINYNWGSGSPDPSVNIDNFTARYTGIVHFDEGTYRFTTTSDDGVRLKINGETKIDQWVNQAPTTKQVEVTLPEGNHHVILEYYENGGGAMVTLSWEKINTETPQLRVMPLGDSLTDGYDIPGAYRIELKNLVENINFVGSAQNGPGELTDREHEGHSGWRIDEIQSQITGWLQSQNPEMILLLIGTNDMIGNHDVQNAPSRLSTLIDTIATNKPQAEILVANVPPLANGEYQSRATSFNQSIPGIITQKRNDGKKVHFVDLNSAITTADLPDGIHPNAGGHAKIAARFAEAIGIVRSGGTPSIPTNPETPTPTPTNTPTPTPTTISEPVGTGLFTAQYYNNRTLSGSPIFTRQEESIYYDWENGSPHASVHTNDFSARWTTTQTFEEGVYRFTTTADDGIRLKIDGFVEIDNWIDQGPTSFSVLVALNGQHTIEVEYYERGGGALAKLVWMKEPDIAPPEEVEIPLDDGFRADYFNNTAIDGVPVYTNHTPSVNFDWASGSPHTTVNTDNFSARWQGDFTFDPGVYRFTVIGDDGVRLKINDNLVIDKWIDQGPTTYTADVNLSGVNRITLAYYEKSGGATAQFKWTQIEQTNPPKVPQGAWLAQYYNNINLTGQPVLSRSESHPYNDWGMSSPDPLVNNDNFSARWTTTETFANSIYRFTVTADDGVRLNIDGNTVIDKWIDQGATTYSVDIPMTEGDHTIVIEYYERGWGAIAKFEAIMIGAPQAPDPGGNNYSISYFNNTTLSGSPVHIAVASSIDFDWGLGSPHTSVQTNDFSARATKTQPFEAGTYRFSVTADDGVRLNIDGNTVIDKWIDQSATTYTVDVPLTAGDHTVTIEYYEKGWGAILKQSMQKL